MFLTTRGASMNLDDFSAHLKYERQLSPNTINNYVAFVRELTDYLKKDLGDASREDMRSFFRFIDEVRGISKSSASNYIIAFRSAYNWMADTTQDESIIKMSFFLSKIMRIKRTSKIPPIPTNQEIVKLRKTLEAYKLAASFNRNSAFFNSILRETAVIELLATTGLRSNELRNLRHRDVDLVNRIIYIRVGKGDQQRMSLFDSPAHVALSEFLGNHSFEDSALLFPYKQGNVLNCIIKKWATRAGINDKIHAHSFRHYFITESQRQGVRMEIVAEQVGHRSLNTTKGYSHYNIEFIRDQFKSCKI